MYRRHRLRVRWLAVAAALAVGWSLGVAAPAGSAPEASGLAEQITALRQQKVDWRAELGSSLARLRGVRGVTTPVGGTVLADTVTVPGTIELTADTTIIAREIVLSTGSVRVHGKGHTLRIYPVASLRSGTQGTITIDYTGTTGLRGANGPKGGDGQAGSRGDPGQHAQNPINCHGGDGQAGESGGSGGPASDGGPALEGGDGGGIFLEIPDGATDTYVLITRGGAGGSGGAGGPGGSGGAGGNGGEGGNGYSFCWFTPPDFGRGGNGGDGGWGGPGGPGGWGGSGGPGGRGGDVWVTYPNEYDLGQLFIDNSGGSGGNPGPAGPGGNGGFGGLGGQAGQSVEGFSWPGQNGWNGFDGPPGQQGWAGAPGNSGNTRVDPR